VDPAAAKPFAVARKVRRFGIPQKHYLGTVLRRDLFA
jgi:hypothetical protein